MVWKELWNELRHQGDVGEESLAAVPYLVRAYRERGVIDWNTFAIVAVIELARNEGKNPDVPGWLEGDYFNVIRELVELAATDVLRAKGADEVRCMLSIFALGKGLMSHAKFLLDYSEDETSDLEIAWKTAP